jgi:RNA polymerase sigma-70 factor (ECF subfamily)
VRQISSVSHQKLVVSFVRLTRPHHEALFRIALTLCHDHDQAADLTQEALIRAFRAFDRFDQERPVLPWLARILKNVHLDSFKTARSRHEIATHQLATGRSDPFAFVSSNQPDPASRAETAQLTRWVQQELQELDEEGQLVVLMCDIEGFTYQEAAEVTGVPVGTVRSRLSRARQRLRVRIEARIAATRHERKKR